MRLLGASVSRRKGCSLADQSEGFGRENQQHNISEILPMLAPRPTSRARGRQATAGPTTLVGSSGVCGATASWRDAADSVTAYTLGCRCATEDGLLSQPLFEQARGFLADGRQFGQRCRPVCVGARALFAIATQELDAIASKLVLQGP